MHDTELMVAAFSQIPLAKLYQRIQRFRPTPNLPDLSSLSDLLNEAKVSPLQTPFDLYEGTSRRTLQAFWQMVQQGRKSTKYLQQAQSLYAIQPSNPLALLIGVHLYQWQPEAFAPFMQAHLHKHPEAVRLRCRGAMTLFYDHDDTVDLSHLLAPYLGEAPDFWHYLSAGSSASLHPAERLFDISWTQALWYLRKPHQAGENMLAQALYALNFCFRIVEHHSPLFLSPSVEHLQNMLLYWLQTLSAYYDQEQDFYLPLVEKQLEKALHGGSL